MNYDIHNKVLIKTALQPQEIASDTTTVGEEIDAQGAESAEFAINAGVITDGSFLPLLEEADDDGAGSPDTFAAVADQDMLPRTAAEVGATIAAADDAKTAKLGYIGNKQWLRLSIVSSGTTSGGFLGASVILGNQREKPKSAQLV